MTWGSRHGTRVLTHPHICDHDMFDDIFDDMFHDLFHDVWGHFTREYSDIPDRSNQKSPGLARFADRIRPWPHATNLTAKPFPFSFKTATDGQLGI